MVTDKIQIFQFAVPAWDIRNSYIFTFDHSSFV